MCGATALSEQLRLSDRPQRLSAHHGKTMDYLEGTRGTPVMMQVAQNYRSGELAVLDVPVPRGAPGGVLVRSLYSLISTGTEVMKVNESRMSLLGKARARPEQVKKVVDTVAQQGPVSAYQKAMNRLDSYTPLGYSLCGVVIEVGEGAEEFHIGQVVACAGNDFALHAEINWVPRNLCVAVPDGVPPESAAFATVGAIAMQGVRQADAQLGETACVIGLGLVGQLVAQLLVAAGVRVVGVDLSAERCRLAEKCGAILCAKPDEAGLASLEAVLATASDGLGADRIFLAASGPSLGPVETAARLARDRATIVDIGKCNLSLPWNAYYEKELELRFSRSYGPGRYDPQYEMQGIDYPGAYVRWTERRNIRCFLDLLATGDLEVQALVSDIFPIERAPSVYERLQEGALGGIGYLFGYPPQAAPHQVRVRPAEAAHQPEDRTPVPRPSQHTRTTPLAIGFVGAGNYASSMVLPHLARRADVELRRVATTKSLSAVNAQRKFGFAEVTTDAGEVLDDTDLDAVFVMTRHSSHASLICRALHSGQSVFAEKPLCLSEEQLAGVLDTVGSTGNDRLMVGFNRRFSPLLTEMHRRFGPTTGPAVARYLVNAGRLAEGSWYSQKTLEGSRFIGEGGHFIDTLSWWLGADPIAVRADQSGDGQDLNVLLHYDDGSIATVTYITSGHARFPKETFDVSSAGRSARLDNFKRAGVYTARRPWTTRTMTSDKGQRGEIDAFLGAVRSGGPMPIGLNSLITTTRACFAAEHSAASGAVVPIPAGSPASA